MELALQVTIAMPNVPSSLAKVGHALPSSRINIDAISCTEGPTHTMIHMIVDDPETAKLVLKKLGEVSINSVIAFRMKNSPGAIANIGRACAGVGANIGMIYATTCGKEAMVYVSVSDVAGAIESLKQWEKSAGKLA